MRKLGLELESESGRGTEAQSTSGRRRLVCMATMGIRRMLARLTDITAQIILQAACLLAQVRGSVATTVAGGTETVTDSVIAGNSVAKVIGVVIVDSAGTKDSTAAENPVAASTEVTSFTVAVGSTAEAVAEVHAAGADSMVGASPTEGVADSRYSNLLSHLNGWQPMLPAVFL
jgi:hypothetical protein